ncbi:MAG: GAF domain-containing protein [Gammaproteobacteria bacterium]|nr:GAF domain-containing protein [Gammaproteobacteria bacterium]
MSELIERIEKLNEIGIALSAETDTKKLLERILLGATSLTHADGGTLYLKDGEHLYFEIIHNESLRIHLGGSDSEEIKFPPVELYNSGIGNHSMVVTHAVLAEKTINIPDVYDETEFDFTGAKKFDAANNYRTQSILTIPLKDHENEIIGVLQLINATDPKTEAVTAFSTIDQQLSESLASQAAVALAQKKLIAELHNLFEAFIKMIADAIDDKSPYTGGHCRRIPILTMMLAEAVNNETSGPMQSFKINDKDRYELETAAWLHDCGKVITPEHVMDKSTKLEAVFDRIGLIETRFEVVLRDAKINYLSDCLDAQKEGKPCFEIKKNYEATKARLENDLEFLSRANIGGEFMTDADIQRVNSIANMEWMDKDEVIHPLLSDDERMNLSIQKGTLNDEERVIINDHIVATIKMLEALPFPKHLANVPEYAGGHHERMDGKGYPNGLTKDQMSVQARIMAVADIFEALTARDRPYKQGKKLTECLKIMGFMSLEQHIDADLFKIFIEQEIYLKYAESYLDPQQIDEVVVANIPGLS